MGFRFSSDFRMWNSFGHLFFHGCMGCELASQHSMPWLQALASNGATGARPCRSLVWAIRVLGIIGSGLGELEGHSGDGRDRVYVVQIQASRAISDLVFFGV